MGKHFTLDDRVQIQVMLSEGKSTKEISEALSKNPSTVKREILKRRIEVKTFPFGKIHNRCINRLGCTKSNVCTRKNDCYRSCRTCNFCNISCKDYIEEKCEKLTLPPYVCNGCSSEKVCVLRKYKYDARKADAEYREGLSAYREGYNMTTGELKRIDSIVSPCIKNGQSIRSVYVNNANELSVSERSLQRFIHDGNLSACTLDQQRVCKLKPRKGEKKPFKIDSKCRIGRTFSDFLSFCDDNPGISEVQIDSVIGSRGGKVLLTMMFPKAEFMLAFLREHNDAASVIDIFNHIYKELGHSLFIRVFGLILTDNGSEFSNPRAIEYSEDGIRRCNLFYCDPGASYQKPHVERNHEFIRLILPKGSSFDLLTQDSINLMMSHINSYSRPGLNNKSPAEMLRLLYDDDAESILRLVCHTDIPGNDIVLKPRLLRR